MNRMAALSMATVAICWLPAGPAHAVDPAASLSLEIDHPRVSQLRLEMWDAAGRAVYDSGLVAGSSLDLDGATLGLDGDGLRYELRAFDSAGELVFSQLSTLDGGLGDEIFSIDFETIPPSTTLAGSSPIRLLADVEVSGTLSANSVEATSLEATFLRGPGGGAFFSACPGGSAIRSIGADGAVSCDSAGDNLGDHQADRNIFFEDVGEGLQAVGGARLLTGPLGSTFFAQAGSSASDRFGVKDVSGNRSFIVDSEGSVTLAAFTPGGTPVDDAIGLGSDGSAFIQMAGSGTPYIDFANDLASDFDMRILLSGDDSLTFDGGRLGIGGTMTNPAYKLDLPNLPNVNGQGRANAWKTYSCARIMRSVEPVPGALDKIKQLRGVEFNWTDEPAGASRNLGFVAEEVADVLPSLVDWEENGIDAAALEVDGIVPVLVEAVKEQQAMIEALGARLQALE